MVDGRRLLRVLALGLVALSAGMLASRAAEETPAEKPAKLVRAYALTSSRDPTGRDPANWQLVASGDGGRTWALLDIQSNQVFTARSQRRIFHISNSRAYPVYRLVVNASAGIRLGELELMGPPANVAQEIDLDVVRTSSGEQLVAAPDLVDDAAARRLNDLAGGRCSWVQYEYVSRAASAAMVNLIGYALTSANDRPARDPSDWRLLGSNDDGRSWSLLDERHDERFGKRLQRREFTLGKPAACRAYRLQIDSVLAPANQTNGEGSVQLAEVEPLLSPTNGLGGLSLIPSAHGEHFPVETAAAAFDGNPATKWLDYSGRVDPAHNSSWIQWRYAGRAKGLADADLGWLEGGIGAAGPGRIVTGYALTSASSLERPDPSDWQLAGSNDGGVSWVTLDTQTKQVFTTRSQRRLYAVANRKAYGAYRLTIYAALAVDLAELELLGPAVNVEQETNLQELITSSGEQAIIGPGRQAFDHDPATKWVGLNTGEKTCWIQCQYVWHAENVVTDARQILNLEQRLAANPVFDDAGDILAKLRSKGGRPARRVTGYALTSANDHPERDPRDWRLLGLGEDGTSWTVLDERHNESFSRRFQRLQFAVAHPGTYRAYRWEVESVRIPEDMFGGNSVQLAEIEPLYGAGEGDNGLSLVVSAAGENPPRETTEEAFDENLESKWLDFISVPGQTNRTSWIQWQYIPRVRERVVNLRWLQGAGSRSAEAPQVRLEGVVVSWNAEDRELGFLDGSGFQRLRLGGAGGEFDSGEKIRLGGQLTFAEGQAVVLSPQVTRLGVVGAANERNLDASFASGDDFVQGSVVGSVTFVSERTGERSIRMNRENGGGRLLVRVLNSGHLPDDLLAPGCRLRAQGVVQSVLNQKLQRTAGVVWVSDPRRITLESVSAQDWRKWPAYTLAALQESSVAPPRLVRTQGIIVSQRAGEGLTIGDGTNQLAILSSQTNVFGANATVEVLGFLTKSNGQPALWLAQVRVAPQTPPVMDGAAESVTQIRRIRELVRTHPTNTIPVKVRGVITYVDMGFDKFYIQDGADAVVVGNQLSAGLFPFFQQEGMYVEFEGECREGGVLPTEAARALGRGQMPEPRRYTWNTMMTGDAADQWVEAEGVVSAVEKQRFTLTAVGGRLTVWVNTLGAGLYHRLLGSMVRVRGVCSPLRNNRNQVLALRLLVPSDEYIEIVEAAPANLFDLPATAMGDVMDAEASQNGLNRMVKTSGVVTYKDQLLLFVQDGNGAMRVLLRKDANVRAGDQVEVAGLPEADGFAPKLTQALVRKTGTGELPLAKPIDLLRHSFSDAGDQRDGSRCQIEATYVGHNLDGTAPTLTFQDEPTKQMFSAYLPGDTPLFAFPPPGSRVRLEGVIKAKMDTVLDYDQVVTAFEMYVNSPAELTVLQRPSWWSARHTFWVLTVVGLVLLMAFSWIRLLREQVQQRTRELREEIEQRKRVEIQVENTYKELMVVSRQAGMAEIATNVLHNVGNVLNSVNISSVLIADKIRNLKVGNLARVVALVRGREEDLGDFFKNDPKGKQIPGYLADLAAHLAHEQTVVLEEAGSLIGNIDHIKQIVAMQQSYAKASGVMEFHQAADLVKDALRMNNDAIIRHHIKVVCNFSPVPPLLTDKHQVIQILVNLIRNAKQACDASSRTDKQITLRVTGQNDKVQVSVIDNGAGIGEENRTRIFSHGFTTRKDGHGFGLHSGANAAKELGGTLTVFSEGEGRGAAFTLELPVRNQNSASQSRAVSATTGNG